MQTILDGIMGRILEKIAVRLALLAGVAAGLVFLALYLFDHIYWR